MTFLFNLHKNQFLSSNVSAKLAELAKKDANSTDEDNENGINVVKVSDGMEEPASESEETKKEKEE